MKYFTSAAIICSSWAVLANLALHDGIKPRSHLLWSQCLLILPGNALLINSPWLTCRFGSLALCLLSWVRSAIQEEAGCAWPGGYGEMAVEREGRHSVDVLAGCFSLWEVALQGLYFWPTELPLSLSAKEAVLSANQDLASDSLRMSQVALWWFSVPTSSVDQTTSGFSSFLVPPLPFIPSLPDCSPVLAIPQELHLLVSVGKITIELHGCFHKKMCHSVGELKGGGLLPFLIF